jgi:hypothetical protein
MSAKISSPHSIIDDLLNEMDLAGNTNPIRFDPSTGALRT